MSAYQSINQSITLGDFAESQDAVSGGGERGMMYTVCLASVSVRPVYLRVRALTCLAAGFPDIFCCSVTFWLENRIFFVFVFGWFPFVQCILYILFVCYCCHVYREYIFSQCDELPGSPLLSYFLLLSHIYVCNVIITCRFPSCPICLLVLSYMYICVCDVIDFALLSRTYMSICNVTITSRFPRL